ncbi:MULTISPECIES: glutathione S-transferase N-terminal domain-containing protein [Thiomicrorhabdus]|uniref:Glutathione S-transferase N-terminal domain-containing protein n=1 Tax=Thiomicrorhabdus heinhorstiae TaxID=2748010 RepID=A0ABS0BXD2_9GAMM|nr:MULTISPECIES: glutathione S-transferase N-terminal domain-containing protein [Thiomicrorhabdus]MBF6058420.1 glutathione S-transferase N-terminal domain-containing protein [Thiomicrorhabdus heinhorstiae]
MSEIPVTKRSVMVLFSDPKSPSCHRVRLVAKEKDIPMDIIEVDTDSLPEDLLELNPYGTLPTLVDRELVLYDPQVIIEYLDERFPHPPLMSVDPISKARARQMLRQIETEWYPLVETIMHSDDEAAVKTARRDLLERLIQLIPVFAHKPYFMSEDYSLVDISMAVMLWRLPYLGIELPKTAKPIMDYAEKVLNREMFSESLSDDELDMRD